MNKKLILGVMAAIVILSGFTACKDKEIENNISSVSGEIETVVDNNTYNNGELFVRYKGKTYYREYNNSDIEESGIGGNYGYRKDLKTLKYINAISDNGKIENVFEDNGFGQIYILDDRFYLETYNKIYSVNMKGKEYIEFGKGMYIGCDEKNHKIYYKNGNNNMIYYINTQTLRITKVGDYNPFLIDNDILFYKDVSELGKIKISSLDIKTNEIKEICILDNSEQETYDIADVKKYGEKLCVSTGYYAGSLGTYSDSKLSIIDLTTNSHKVIDNNVEEELKIQDDTLYYVLIEDIEAWQTALKKVDLNTMQVSSVNKIVDTIEIDNNNILKNSRDLSYYDENLNKIEIVSEKDLDNFKEKYNISFGDEKIFIEANNIEVTKDKIFYTIQLSRENEEYSIGWRTGYERIATEVYMYDLNSNKNTMLYMYKATDKEEIISGDIYVSGETIEDNEPLAENEMYLEIKLADKGLKETFNIRVEEVGGLIIGKRIEYEGTHSRSEGILKIKVTKEIGAMLTVYIDDKVDSQMLIEE